MSWRRIIGILLILISLFLAILLSAKLPFFKSNTVLDISEFELTPGIHNPYNITLEPLTKNEYRVEVEISSPSPIYFDFWVVNETELDLLIELMSWPVFQSDYPYNYPFDLIRGHAKEINITGIRRFELVNLDRNGKYCLVFINLWEEFTQHVSIRVKEYYLEEPARSLLEPHPLNITIVVGIAVLGVYLTVSPKSVAKRKRRRRLPKRS